ncbi:IclR family transcriptional regulator, partial [Pseudomonas aeruginosa]|nr:IclR family transcriptional regulator [Pseudomonas aeruginosa]
APVFDARGRVAAVLTVGGPASIFQAEEQGPAAERLLATTRAISWRMGYDGTQGG